MARAWAVLFFAFCAYFASPKLEAAALAAPASFNKLPCEYTISFGSPEAPIHVVEYFSLGCQKCVAFIRKDFPNLQSMYIEPKEVFWTFHPDPADLLTLQAMVCLKNLTPQEKQLFLMKVASTISPHSSKRDAEKLEKILLSMDQVVPPIRDLAFIEKSDAFHEAYAYLQQESAPTELPTVEINGLLYQEFPSVQWIQKTIRRQQIPTSNRGIYEN